MYPALLGWSLVNGKWGNLEKKSHRKPDEQSIFCPVQIGITKHANTNRTHFCLTPLHRRVTFTALDMIASLPWLNPASSKSSERLVFSRGNFSPILACVICILAAPWRNVNGKPSISAHTVIKDNQACYYSCKVFDKSKAGCAMSTYSQSQIIVCPI